MVHPAAAATDATRCRVDCLHQDIARQVLGWTLGVAGNFDTDHSTFPLESANRLRLEEAYHA